MTFESVHKPNFVLANQPDKSGSKSTVLNLVDRASHAVTSNPDVACFLVQEVCDLHGRLRRGWMSFQSCSSPESYIRQRSGRIRCEEEGAATNIARLDGTFELLERPDYRHAVDVHELRQRAAEVAAAEARSGPAGDDPTTIVWAASMEMSISMLRVLGPTNVALFTEVSNRMMRVICEQNTPMCLRTIPKSKPTVLGGVLDDLARFLLEVQNDPSLDMPSSEEGGARSEDSVAIKRHALSLLAAISWERSQVKELVQGESAPTTSYTARSIVPASAPLAIPPNTPLIKRQPSNHLRLSGDDNAREGHATAARRPSDEATAGLPAWH